MQCIAIEKWRADRGMVPSEAVERGRNAMKTRTKAKPASADRLPCKNPDCAVQGTYRVTAKHPFCNDCQRHGFSSTKAGKAIESGRFQELQANKPTAVKPRFARTPSIIVRKKRVPREPDLPIALKEPVPDTVSVELRVCPGWLDIAWARLDLNQKARALAVVLAE